MQHNTAIPQEALVRQNHSQLLTSTIMKCAHFSDSWLTRTKVGFEKARPNAPKRDSHIPVNSPSHIRLCVSIRVSKLAMTFKSGYGEDQINLNRPKNIFSDFKTNNRAFRW